MKTENAVFILGGLMLALNGFPITGSLCIWYGFMSIPDKDDK